MKQNNSSINRGNWNMDINNKIDKYLSEGKDLKSLLAKLESNYNEQKELYMSSDPNAQRQIDSMEKEKENKKIKSEIDRLRKSGVNDSIDCLLADFVLLNESKKSKFVAKLIGLGVLVKDKNGKLKPGKNKMSKEEVLKKLKKKGS